MPEPDKDELADALARLASGDAPSAPEGIPSEQVPLTPHPERPKRPVSPSAPPRAPSNAPRAGSPAPRENPGLPSGVGRERKEAPKQPSSARPLPTPAPAPIPKAPAPRVTPKQAGAAKPLRPAAPVRRDAPDGAHPQAPAPVQSEGAVEASAESVIDDDDTMAIPAPEAAVFRHRPLPPKPKRQALHSRLEFRRTMIPILLTMGIALPVCAVWWIFLDPDSPLKSISVGYPITLACVGAVLLALGVMNMLQVRRELSLAQRE